MKIFCLTSSCVTAVALTACAGLPGPLPPPHALLTADNAVPLASTTAAASAPDWLQADAWASWGDPALNALVATALERQPALRQVQARLAQAQAAVDVADAAHGSQANVSVDLSDQRFTENGLVPPPLAGRIYWNNSAQVGASWEWDLFGRQRAALAAAVGQQRAASAEAQAAAVLLAANVAAAYVTLARGIALRDITLTALDQRRQVGELVGQRVTAGLDTVVEQRQADTALAQAQLEAEAAAEQIDRARHALAELTGQQPDALAALAPRLAAVNELPLPSTLPADLLGRRADLVAQRWRVEAATQDVAVARAAFYPNLNLVGFAGLSSLGLDTFLRAGSLTYGLGPALRLPLFDGGRLRANLNARAAEVDAAVEGYNTALLRALREVADEVSSLQAIERQQRAQAQALDAAESAFDLARQRYQAGLGNFLTVLTAQATVLAQRRVTAELKARHLLAETALSRALGGGWRDAAAAAIATPSAEPTSHAVPHAVLKELP